MPALNLVPSAPADRHAAALSDIRDMHDQLTDALATIGQLRADLHREQDRCTMIIEERNRYRASDEKKTILLTELATQMSNISLLCVKAQEVVATVHELSDAPVQDAAE
jgi:small ligand-binding sensory domain FIST